MKIVFRLLLAATLLTPTLAAADLIIYKGTRTDAFTGEGHGGFLTKKQILIVDYQNVQASVIHYSSANGVKSYKVEPLIDPHFVHVRGAKGDFTAIARTPLQNEINAGVAGDRAYFHGENAMLTVNSAANSKVTIPFPKVMHGHVGSSIAYSDSTGEATLTWGGWNVSFDSAGTLKSNHAGESFDAALARYSAALESLGYVQQGGIED
ncbi:hypothetical protein [Methylomicrobium lacus]|uniref:hypothetical protein n=1 Tax=Methylomicrobium lacus TaxID=136992 RepID=UPI0035A9AAFA